MVDNYIIISIISAITVIASVITLNFWNNRNRKDTVNQNKQTLQSLVERTAREKNKDEEQTAKELQQKQERQALATKQDMKDHIDRLISTFKQDVELERVKTYAKMELIDIRVAQLKIDLMEHIINEKDERVRMQRSIDFFQTMQYGPDARSTPAYLTGEEETEEHKDEPDKGVFASRKDTTHEDTKDPV